MKTKPCPFYFWSLEPCSHSVRRKTAGCTWGHREGLRPAGAESCWAGAQGPRKSKKSMVWGGWLQRDWEFGTHRGNDRVNDQEGQYMVA